MLAVHCWYYACDYKEPMLGAQWYSIQCECRGERKQAAYILATKDEGGCQHLH